MPQMICDLLELSKVPSMEIHYELRDYGVHVSKTWDLLELSKVPSRDSPVNNMELLEEFLFVVSLSGTRVWVRLVKVSSRETKHLSGQVEEEGTVC